MEIDLHICSFQNPLSLFFSFLTECLRIPFLFTLTASFIREKPIEEAYAYILFQTVFTWLNQLQVKKTLVQKVSRGIVQTLGTLAAGLQFPAPSWPRSWPWRWYQKMPITFIRWGSMLNNFPKINGWATKLRAPGHYFPTPWVWSLPWGNANNV